VRLSVIQLQIGLTVGENAVGGGGGGARGTTTAALIRASVFRGCCSSYVAGRVLLLILAVSSDGLAGIFNISSKASVPDLVE
jgi:hypothetical protein